MKALKASSIRHYSYANLTLAWRDMAVMERYYGVKAGNEPCYIGKVARKNAVQARKNIVLIEAEMNRRVQKQFEAKLNTLRRR